MATDSLFPEWKIWTQFLDESTEGLRLDGLEESHPIEVTKISVYAVNCDTVLRNAVNICVMIA